MDLLDIPLPELTLKIDISPEAFFDQCEPLARARGWRTDRRRAFAGPGYDQLNIYLGVGPTGYPMLRMVGVPSSPHHVSLDVVADWQSRPLDYEEYVGVARTAFKRLFDAVEANHGRRHRLRVPKRPDSVDMSKVHCGQMSYAAEKFSGLTRSLAIGEGDARERLISAFWTFHVIRPEDLPPPLRKHLAWVYAQITKRAARHRWEGVVEGTVRTMKNATAAAVLERLVDLADAIAALDEKCNGSRGRAV